MTSKPEVELSTGRLRGSLLASGIHRYLGVPFAAPPVGPLRFRAPAPPMAWSGVREALSFSPSAPQRDVAGLLGEMIGIAPGEQGEDCLYLNLWTPGCDGARRPVMVWVHGGGNLVGSGAQPRMDGEALARRGDVVVVTFNYRLGALGFLHAPELGASGNEALLDQVAALRWVKREVAAFGGDPDNVTVFGQSAGGFDIAALLALEAAQGAFDKAILMSGTARTHVSPEAGAHTAKVFAEPFGGVTRLRDVPVRDLIARQAELARNPLGGEHRFSPTLDGEWMCDQIEAAVADGRFDRGIPVMVGTARHEWNLFSAFDPRFAKLEVDALRTHLAKRFGADRARVDELIGVYTDALADEGEPTDPLTVWNAAVTDVSFRMPGHRLAELHARHTPHTFMYRFDRESPGLEGRLRACHSIDVPFVFGTTGLESLQALLGSGPELAALSGRVMDAYVAFARSGSPATLELPEWPRYSADTRSVMCFDDVSSLASDPESERRDFWERYGAVE